MNYEITEIMKNEIHMNYEIAKIMKNEMNEVNEMNENHEKWHKKITRNNKSKILLHFWIFESRKS